jgi:hypothetical protein
MQVCMGSCMASQLVFQHSHAQHVWGYVWAVTYASNKVLKCMYGQLHGQANKLLIKSSHKHLQLVKGGLPI